jgi:hypothetical protein
MARSKAQLTHAKRAREIARQEKRARKQEKKDARKLAAADPADDTEPAMGTESDELADPGTLPDDQPGV